LNVGDIKQFPIPLPPLDEQQEIGRRVADLLVLADRIETNYGKAKARLDRLMPAILAKAFRGELVPTEVELAKADGRLYETAEQLLARVQATATSTHNVRIGRVGGMAEGHPRGPSR
jgi:type I restriction enzyme S subunit